MEKTIFTTLAAVDVNDHIDKKKTTDTTELSYLSWAWAWDYFKKACPDAKYEIKHWDGKPYMYDENAGYMVETSITAQGETHSMWLPVMDGANRALLGRAYTVRVKKYNGGKYDYEEKEIPAATMFDINKTIMRCLVKNMAMFGLGLYIYAGEDLPSDTEEEKTIKTEKPAPKKADSNINDLVGDEIPFEAPTTAHPNDWLSVNAFAGEMERCNDVAEISRILNGQKGNPHINDLIPLASARKQEILDNLQMEM